MARLTDPSTRERPIPRVARGSAQLAAIGPSPAVGAGAEALGREARAGLDELYRAQQLEEDRINTTRAEEAYTKLRERKLELTLDEQTGFARLKGAEAVNKPLMSEWGKRFEDATTEIAATL